MDDAVATTTRTSWVRQRSDFLAALALIIASFVFVTDQVTEHEMISPIDEYQYIGYYAVVADQGMVRQGEAMPFFTRRYMACNGIRHVPEMAPNRVACRAPDNKDHPIGGGTTADLYTPLYFLSTRALAQPLVWAGVPFVDAGRAVGGVWLSLGAVFLYLALRRARVPTPVALGLGLVLVGSLPAYWSTTYISTDAPALAAGAMAAWLTLRALDGVRGALILLPVAAAVATLFKLQNVIGFAAAAAVLLLAAAFGSESDDRRPLTRSRAFFRDRRTITAVMVLVAPVAAQAIWLAIRAALAVGPSPTLGEAVPLAWQNVVSELGNFLPFIAQGALPPSVTGPASVPVFLIGTVLAVGGAAGLAMSKGVEARHRMVGASTVLVTILAAPALAVVIGVTAGLYIPLPTRYGHTMFPWALLCAGLLMDTRRPWARYAVLGLGVMTWCIALMAGEG
jgi:hypothetical protein